MDEYHAALAVMRQGAPLAGLWVDRVAKDLDDISASAASAFAMHAPRGPLE